MRSQYLSPLTLPVPGHDMLKSLRLLTSLILLSFASSCIPLVQAQALSAFEIMDASYKVYRGEDAYARLTFTFYNEAKRSSKVIMSMAWKNYHNIDGVDSKIIMFNEFPPDTKDVGFMAWLYDPEINRQDDMWLYLPELMTVRKMGYMDDSLQNQGSDQDYSKSELKRYELMPRHPRMDNHVLSGTEIIYEDKQCYVIESRPIISSTSPYAKRIQWITTENFLPLRIDYFYENDKVIKQQFIQWQNIDNVWTWKMVTAINLENGNRTVLEQTDMLINIGLSDDIFTKRTMQLGATSLKVRINRLTN